MKTITFTFFACLLSIGAFAQPINKSLHINDKNIYRLDGGVLKIYSENGRLQNTIKHPVAIRSIYFDADGRLVTLDLNNNIRKLLSSNKWTSIGNYGLKIYGLGFNSKNQCYLVTDGGIVDRESGKIYRPDSSLMHSEWSRTRMGNGLDQENRLSPAFIDSFDVLWTSVSHGEWGTDIIAFNTLTKDFVDAPFSDFIPSIEIGRDLYAVKNNMFRFDVLKITRQFINGKLSFKTNFLYDSDKDKELANINAPGVVDVGAYVYDGIRKMLYVVFRDKVYAASTQKKIAGFKSFVPFKKLNALLPHNNRQAFMGVTWDMDVSPNGNITILRDNKLIIYNGKTLLKIE